MSNLSAKNGNKSRINSEQIPWVTTLGQKTLGPYHKYIVKGSPKTPFFSFSFCQYVGTPFSLRYSHTFLPPSRCHTIPTQYVDTFFIPTQRTSLWRGKPLPRRPQWPTLQERRYNICLFVFYLVYPSHIYFLFVTNMFYCFSFHELSLPVPLT